MQTVKFIPDSMKRFNQWGVWKKEIINSKTRKIPYSAVYEGKASTDNRDAWTTYSKASNALANGAYDGLGFCLMGDITCIDLDGAVDENGNLTRLASNILDHFNDTFVEVSQSGCGLHVFCYAQIPKAAKAKCVEIYDSKRYIAVTGNSVVPNELVNKQADVDTLYRWLTRDRQDAGMQERLPRVCVSLSAQDIIAKASTSRGGEVFQALYAGDWQQLGIGDGSQSSADLAFSNRLAYWTGCNKAMMEEIFQASGLYRNPRKMNLAINRALRDCTTVYEGKGGDRSE